ncbi:MAG TPA: DUF4203 domain-containing protein, partial [Candidatus Hydrogenedentes bacterium]|nr:DUF4203 domain-containing protein [Candidatus Hydrogenedentota bacterium]
MPELTEDVLNMCAMGVLATGAVLCFLGYRVFLLLLAVGGLVVGAVAAGLAGLSISEDQTIAILSAVLGGFIGAVLMILLYFAVLFTIGAVTAGVIGYFVCIYTGTALTTVSVVAILVAALLGGILALVLQRFIIVLTSSAKGSVFLVLGIFYYVKRATLAPLLTGLYAAIAGEISEKGPDEAFRSGFALSPELSEGLSRAFSATSFYLMALGALALTLLGVAVQYTVTARPPKPKKEQA